MAETAKNKLRSKRVGNLGNMDVVVNPPPIRVNMPKIKVPEVKIPPINVPAADLGPVAAVIGQLSSAIQQIAAQQNAILAAIKQSADKQIDIKLPEPKPRSRRYYVSFDREDGETVGLLIEADKRT